MVSDLKSHKYKKGLIQTPMNTIPNTQSVSWTNDRLPEYLWLGLILMNYPRTQGIEKVGTILREISQKNEFILKPKITICSNPLYSKTMPCFFSSMSSFGMVLISFIFFPKTSPANLFIFISTFLHASIVIMCFRL